MIVTGYAEESGLRFDLPPTWGIQNDGSGPRNRLGQSLDRYEGFCVDQLGGEEGTAISSSCSLSADSLRSESRSRYEPTASRPELPRQTLTSHSKIPQLAASSCDALKICCNAEIVANCEPPPTPGNWMSEPRMLDPIRSKTFDTVMWSSAAPYECVTSRYAIAISSHIRMDTPDSCRNDPRL